MKLLRFGLIFTFCLLVSITHAQTREKKEAALLKSFKQLNHLIAQKFTDTTGAVVDSLLTYDFNDKLASYLRKYPFAIKAFDSLNSEGLGIASSDDGKIRFYTWDTGTGGQQHELSNLCQYKTRNGPKLTANVVVQPYGDVAFIDTMYRFQAGDHSYYAVLWGTAVGAIDHYSGIMIFGIEKDSLNTDIRIIKTGTGLHSYLSYYFQASNDDATDVVTDIIFDPIKRIIKLPLINEDDHPTSKYIVYKFTGRYFERIKN